MIYLKLIIDFFTVGILSFGGAYSAIPLVKDVASHYAVITDELLVDFIAISESTPGPVAVNLATFVGTTTAGLPGAIVATIAEVLPAFIIILVFTMFFGDILKNKRVEYALAMIRPCIIGLIMAVGVSLYYKNLVPSVIKFINYRKFNKELIGEVGADAPLGVNFDEIVYNEQFINISKFVAITILIVLFMIFYKKVFKKKLSAIKIIILGAVLGILIA